MHQKYKVKRKKKKEKGGLMVPFYLLTPLFAHLVCICIRTFLILPMFFTTSCPHPTCASHLLPAKLAGWSFCTPLRSVRCKYPLSWLSYHLLETAFFIASTHASMPIPFTPPQRVSSPRHSKSLAGLFPTQSGLAHASSISRLPEQQASVQSPPTTLVYQVHARPALRPSSVDEAPQRQSAVAVRST
ncbi:hypothetical protein IWX49DRAFT_321570 [Phyllosticta citricarpa]|uniref:Uncharacterized protein n=2 Tax=Phyllosticta TaxID=121621 RepID=A0ABR1LH89_9PEZI